MPYETILYERDGAVATITLNRPARLNTIVPPMLEELEQAVIQANRDAEVRVIILRGAGRAFCAGFDFSGDFGHFKDLLYTEGRWDPGKDMIATTSPFAAPVSKFMSLWRSPKPVVAQVHGWCVGGGSDMVLCADIVIAAEDAQIGTPYSRVWGCYLSGMWVYRLGLTKVKWLALTGEALSGKEAAEIDLINKAVPFEQLYATQLLGPILDGYMRNTPDGLRFVDTAAKQGVAAAVAERDRPFGDYSQAPPLRRPNPDHVIRPGSAGTKGT